MKKLFVLLTALFTLAQVNAQEKNVIRIATDNTDLILQVAPNGRLYQAYLGDKLLNEKDINNFSPYVKGGSDGSVSTRGWEVYPCSGAEDYFEPAFAIQHNDGNMTSIFKYVSSESKKLDNNVTETIISLKDDVYPVEAKLHYVTFAKENVIKAWTEIRHMEKKPVTITQYASNMLYFESPRYVLTEFSGDWAKEVQMSSQDLKFGKKIIEELEKVSCMECLSALEVKGNFPYRVKGPSTPQAPVTDNDLCTQCEYCVDVCPTHAISLADEGMYSDPNLCIKCCACVKECPEGARTFDTPYTAMLHKNFSARREPEIFF